MTELKILYIFESACLLVLLYKLLNPKKRNNEPMLLSSKESNPTPNRFLSMGQLKKWIRRGKQ